MREGAEKGRGEGDGEGKRKGPLKGRGWRLIRGWRAGGRGLEGWRAGPEELEVELLGSGGISLSPEPTTFQYIEIVDMFQIIEIIEIGLISII